MPGRGALVTFAVAAALIAVPALPHRADVRLAGVVDADSPLGDGTALILGTSGNPAPPRAIWMPVDALYLAPRGFDGTTQLLSTPEALFPFTGVTSLPFDTSEAQDEKILDTAILSQIAGGKVERRQPRGCLRLVAIRGRRGDGHARARRTRSARSDDVHFVLVGDANNPNGGLLTRFSVDGLTPTVPSLGLPFGGATPANPFRPTSTPTNTTVSPTSPATQSISCPTSTPAWASSSTTPSIPTLEPGQIPNAVRLPVSVADTSTNYYVIPANLPLAGSAAVHPRHRQPAGRLAAAGDVGAGQLWATAASPTAGSHGTGRCADSVGTVAEEPRCRASVLGALINAAPQGITAAIHDLQDPATYQALPAILNNPLTNQLIEVAHALGYTDATNLSQMLSHPQDLLAVAQNALAGFAGFPISQTTLLSSPTDIINDLSGTLAYDFSTLIPVADAADAALTSLPAYDAELFAAELQSGDLLNAGGLPIAADLALIPAALVFGAAAPVEATAGTLINLVDLIPGL